MKSPVAVVIASAMLACLGCVVQPPLVTQCKWPPKGDRTAGPALVGHEYGPQTTPIPLNSVQFSNTATANRLAIQDLFAAHTAANTTAVTARLISCADTVFAVRVRTSFLDESQAPTEPASAWKTVFLQPHLTATYAENSTSRGVANYLIEIMPE